VIADSSASFINSQEIKNFDWSGCTIAVKSEPGDFPEEAAHLWSSSNMQQDTVNEPVLTYEIKRIKLQSDPIHYLLYRNGENVLTTSEQRVITLYLDSDIPSQLIEREKHNVLFHASSLSVNNGAVLIAGESGSGKTSLMLGLVAKGGALSC